MPHIPPAASLLRHPPAPPPPSPESQDAHAAPLPLLQARSGALESSPGHPPAPQTPDSHPCPISPGLQFDRAARLSPETAAAQIAPPSAQAFPDTPARLPLLRYTTRPQLPPAQGCASHPAHSNSRWPRVCRSALSAHPLLAPSPHTNC